MRISARGTVNALRTVVADRVLTYVRLAGKRLGLLVNFGTDRIKDGITRLVHGVPD